MFSTRQSDGVILRDGQPFFPVGAFHVSHFASQDARRLADIGRMAEAGLNTIATPLTKLNAVPVLDQAAAAGMGVLIENNDPVGAVEFSSGLRHPAVLGWQVFDDFGDGKHTDTQYKNQATALRVANPSCLAFASVSAPREAYRVIPLVDIVGVESYPVPGEALSSTTTAVDTVCRAASHTTPPSTDHRSAIAIVQAFNWPGQRLPTPTELRLMVYRAVGAGARGILFYAMFNESSYCLPDTGPLWAEVKLLVRELNSLAPTLLTGVR